MYGPATKFNLREGSCRHSKGKATKVTFCSDHYSIQVQARNVDIA